MRVYEGSVGGGDGHQSGEVCVCFTNTEVKRCKTEIAVSPADFGSQEPSGSHLEFAGLPQPQQARSHAAECPSAERTQVV